MKTLHVITDYSAAEGAQVMLSRLLRHSGGADEVVVALRGASAHNLARSGGARVVPLGIRSPLDLGAAIARLVGVVRAERPQVVLCWMYHAMIAGTLAARGAALRAPVYWTVRQSLDDPAAFSRSTRMAVAVGRRMSTLADGIIYNSERARRLHARAGYRDRKATVIPNGFDLPPLPAISARQPRVFGIAARLHPQKDHATFFRAAARLAQRVPDVRFVAVGRGLDAAAPAVRDLMRDAGLCDDRVELRGEVSDMAAFYRDIDVLVLSSRSEGFPNVVAEAMSHARPVIATDVGDAAAIVGDTGLVVPPSLPDALADAMTIIAQLSPQDYRRLGLAARERIANTYALPIVAAQYRDFLAAGPHAGAAR